MGKEQPDGLLEVNGTQLYHEVRGSGPPVVLIPGGTGDAGQFEQVAESLADQFTVLTYDRRGNSRSPLPQDWDETSTEEQADDAAGLVEALELAPAIVFGTSSGAVIGLDLIIRRPEVLRGAILHEPLLKAALAQPEEVMGPLWKIIEGGMEKGGPPAAVEAFVRSYIRDETFENLDPDLRERMLGNGEVLFDIEFEPLTSYHPNEDALAAAEVPVRVMVSTNSFPYFGETVRWLAERLDAEVNELPGGHAPYLDRPEDVAEAIRPFLSQLTK